MRKERASSSRELAADPQLSKAFWRAVFAPTVPVKIEGPIRPATWDESFDYFYFDKHPQPK